MLLPMRGCLQKVAFTNYAASFVLCGQAFGSKPNFVSPLRFYRANVTQDEAALIKARIPKGLSALNCYVKENFDKTSKEMIKSGILSEQRKAPTILKKILQDFRELPSSELAKYESKATVTKEAHQTAMSHLKNSEKEILLVDKRKRILKKQIFAANKELQALRRKFAYPEAAPSSFFLFLGDQKEALPQKFIVERAKAGSLLWKSATESEKAAYDSRAKQLKSNFRRQMAEWRREMSASHEPSLEKMTRLKSELRKLRLKVTKIDRLPSIGGAKRASKIFRASTKGKKIVRATKSKRVLKRKVSGKKISKKVALKTMSLQRTKQRSTIKKRETPKTKNLVKK